MPLVFAVLIIIVAFSVLGNASKNADKKRADAEIGSLKTNATMEVRLFRKYFFGDGMSHEEAYQKMLKEVKEAGFVPAIPKENFEPPGSREIKTYDIDTKKYETSCIYERKQGLTHYWNQNRNGPEGFAILTEDPYREKIKEMYGYDNSYFRDYIVPDKYVYDDFKSGDDEFYWRLTTMYKITQPNGTRITYPGMGVCRIVNHHINDLLMPCTMYTIVSEQTGREKIIRYDDQGIRYMPK